MHCSLSLHAVALQGRQSHAVAPTLPSHRLVGDHQLHHRKGVEDRNGGYVPEGREGRGKVGRTLGAAP